MHHANVGVAVVTGSNKGIGLACIRALCKKLNPEDVVYLTARNPELGQKAVAELQKEGLKPSFHQLDISKEESVKALRDHLMKEHGGLDILINNAAIAYKSNDTAPQAEQAKVTNEINYFCTARVFAILSPILRPHARVVNVSSGSAIYAWNKIDDSLKQEFKSARTIGDIDALIRKFIELKAAGESEKYGYRSPSSYGISKLALSTITRIQDKEIQKDTSRPGIKVYSVCPGYVNTDMSSHKGHKTPDEGADTLIWLALQPRTTTVQGGEFYTGRKLKEIFV